MGFKNIYAYNLAMLGKQGWRLFSNPHSLIAQLYKARYHPTCSFWEAELGDSPSFSWRSILSGRPVLKAGVQWYIGNGTNVNIWKDKWIPNCHQFLIQKPPGCIFELVSDLIDPTSRQWIPAAVHTAFSPEVAQKKKKAFTQLKLLIGLLELAKVLEHVLASTSRGDPYKALWKTIWNAKVPDTSHIFCHFPTASAILNAPPFNLRRSMLPNIEFKEWMLEQALHLTKESFAKLLMILWALWQNRNNMLWNNVQKPANVLVLSSFAWLEDFTKAHKTDKLSHPKQKKTWTPAAAGQWKLNVDGSFLPSSLHGSVGGVLRDEAGNFKAAFATPIPNVAAAKQVELYAIKEGLKWVSTLQISNVVVETDCLEAVLSIGEQQYTQVLDEAILDDIRQVLQQRTDVVVQHTPRVCNRVAHCLANSAYEANHALVWLTQPPDFILELLTDDCKHLG
ncbi:uncharacterized protein LOC133729988 [Rosa rugosa]|uniref:uncharacterized protein LOC133729988 n=1 Tax=Rosa rugosa TaxID=74645 RepID=UPI002B41429E|nr:uncharacterized protein LOC133729988 [Rosa rugosa]